MFPKHHLLTCWIVCASWCCLAAFRPSGDLLDYKIMTDIYFSQLSVEALFWEREPRSREDENSKSAEASCFKTFNAFTVSHFTTAVSLQQIDIFLVFFSGNRRSEHWFDFLDFFWKLAHSKSSSKEGSPGISLLENTFLDESESWSDSHLESHTRVITIHESSATFQGNVQQAKRGQTQRKSLRPVSGPRWAAADGDVEAWTADSQPVRRQKKRSAASRRPGRLLFTQRYAQLSPGRSLFRGHKRRPCAPVHNGANKLFVSGTTRAHTHTHIRSEASVSGSHSFSGLCK